MNATTTGTLFRNMILSMTLVCWGFGISAQPGREGEISEDAPIAIAVKTNNLKEVTRLVEAGEDFKGDEFWGFNPLEHAIRENYRDVALYLLNKGAISGPGFYAACGTSDVKWIETLYSYGCKDSEAMIAAAENGQLEVVKFLVSKHFPVNVSQKRKPGLFRKYYVSPIGLAIENKYDAIALYLVENGVSADEALELAMVNARSDLAKKLIDKGCDPNKTFLLAIEHSDKTVAEYALQKGASATTLSDKGMNALLIAVENGNRPMVDYTMNVLKLDINSVTASNENALMLACRSGNIDLVKELLDKNANPEFENNAGETALFYANRSENAAIFELFLAVKVNLSHVDHEGNTVLLEAASLEHVERVKALIALGVDPKVTNHDGENLLTYLIIRSNAYAIDKDLLTFLLDLGLDVNTAGKNKETLVFRAMAANDLQLLEFLRGKGASFDPKNSSGERPPCKNADVIRYMIANGADINGQDDWKSTYLCDALAMNDLALAAFLLSKKISLETSCYFEEPVLIKAIRAHNLAFVKFLVESGADVHVIGYFKRNAMEYALEEKEDQEEKKAEGSEWTDMQPIIDYLRAHGARTKEERNQYVLLRMEETNKLNAFLDSNDAPGALAILKKYPDLVLSPDEVKTVAMLSVVSNSLELLRIAVETYHFNLDETLNFEEQTLLFLAVQKNNKSFVTLLVNKGADVQHEDSFGKKAVDYAEDKEIKIFLKERMKAGN